MSSPRISKINELIKQELSKIISREIEFPENTVVTVMRVQTDAEMKKSKIFVSAIPHAQTGGALSVLKKRKPFLQHRLNRTLVMHFVPALSFAIEKEDAVIDEIDEIEHLLDTLHREEI